MFNNEIEAGCYLAGIIDGEGSIGMREFMYRGKFKRTRRVQIINTSLTIVNAIAHVCEILGIQASFYRRVPSRANRLPYWEIAIHDKRSFQAIYRHCPIQDAGKRKALEEILLSYDDSRATYARRVFRDS